MRLLVKALVHVAWERHWPDWYAFAGSDYLVCVRCSRVTR